MGVGVWNNMGVAISPISSDAPEQPNVLYEIGAKILTPNSDGKIFKMIFTTGAPSSPTGLNYAESNDGISWTRYGSNPVLAHRWGGKVFKHGNIYYLYCSAQVFATAIQVYTSTDLISWTLQNSSAITTSASGWDSIAVGQFNVLTIDSNGVWWGYYWGVNTTNFSTVRYNAGMATSVDGVNWTKDLNNPIASLNNGTLANGTSWFGALAATFATINDKYYCWSQMVQTSFPGSNSQLPSDIMRWSATNPAGPWTAIGNVTYSRTTLSEGSNNPMGQVADPCLIEVNEDTYIYYTAAQNQSSGYQINVGKVALTIAQLVQTYEGLVNIPVSGNLSLNLNTLASDNFTRPDANPIGGNWSPLSSASGFGTAQLQSDKVISSTTGVNSDSWWSALSWDVDQWSQITVNACSASSYVGIDVRENISNVVSAYRIYWNGTLGSSGIWTIQSVVSGAFTSLVSGNMTLNVGDVMTATVIGTTVCFYVNGILVGVSEGNIDHVSGSPGFLVTPITSITNSEIISWAGGNFVAAPIIFIFSSQVGSFLVGF